MGSADNEERKPLDADECDRMIEQFRARIDALHKEATQTREEFDRLHRHWQAIKVRHL
jgi:uncharacterized coiled-coil DUF342 family protein